jgi:hypothetical protein
VQHQWIAQGSGGVRDPPCLPIVMGWVDRRLYGCGLSLKGNTGEGENENRENYAHEIGPLEFQSSSLTKK